MRYSEEDILNFIQRAAISVIEASGVPSEEELAKLPFLTHHLCDCPRCSEIETVAHTDFKGVISVSRKNFDIILNREFAFYIGLLDVLHSYIHEVVHNLYPDAPRDDPSPGGICSRLVQEKTKEIWLQGMAKIYPEICPDRDDSKEPDKQA